MRVIEMLKNELGNDCFVKESLGLTYVTIVDFKKNNKAKDYIANLLEKYNEIIPETKFLSSLKDRNTELWSNMVFNFVLKESDLLIFNYGLNLKRDDFKDKYTKEDLDVIFKSKENYYHQGLSFKVREDSPADIFKRMHIHCVNSFFKRYGLGVGTSTITTFPKIFDFFNTVAHRIDYPSLKELEIKAKFIRDNYISNYMDKGETSVFDLKNSTINFPDRVWTKSDSWYLEKLKNKPNKTKSEEIVVNKCGTRGNTDLFLLGELNLNRMLLIRFLYSYNFLVKDGFSALKSSKKYANN
jgi:hypothetical protein